MKWSEGRTTIFGLKSAAWHRRAERRARADEKEQASSLEKKDSAQTPIDEDRQFASHV